VPSILRVVPGDPNNSYIIQKLEGHAAVGAQMPFGGPPLDAAVIAVIRQWITDGAQRSVVPAAFAVHALALSAVAPARDEVLGEAPPAIMIELNQDIDATRIDPGSVRIERRGEDADAPAVEDVPARITIPAANPRALLITPRRTLRAGHYRVVLRGGVGASLSAISGEALGAATPGGASPSDTVATEFDLENPS
jgi:hypothetical protein